MAKPNRTFRLTLPEILCLRRFFEGIDNAISREMDTYNIAYEEFMTSVLGRLLDGRYGYQALLPYSISRLNTDLAQCGSGMGVTIEFETNEHNKRFSGSESHADLGIILRTECPLFGGSFEKAILVECKRLYRAKGRYSFHSRYDAFDTAQCGELRNIDKKFGWSGVFYFLYNPTLASFDEKEGRLIRAFETRLLDDEITFGYTLNCPYERDEYERYGLPRAHRFKSESSHSIEEIKGVFLERVARRPGIKVFAVDTVHQIAHQGAMTLGACYHAGDKLSLLGHGTAIPFLSFSTFIVDVFMACSRGTEDERLRELAAGGSLKGPRDDNGGGEDGLAAQHTLRITIRSNLPNLDDHPRDNQT